MSPLAASLALAASPGRANLLLNANDGCDEETESIEEEKLRVDAVSYSRGPGDLDFGVLNLSVVPKLVPPGDLGNGMSAMIAIRGCACLYQREKLKLLEWKRRSSSDSAT